jgi:hypothetical protein
VQSSSGPPHRGASSQGSANQSNSPPQPAATGTAATRPGDHGQAEGAGKPRASASAGTDASAKSGRRAAPALTINDYLLIVGLVMAIEPPHRGASSKGSANQSDSPPQPAATGTSATRPSDDGHAEGAGKPRASASAGTGASAKSRRRAAPASTTTNRLLIAGLVVTIIGIAVTFVVTVIPQKAACWVRLTSCSASTGTSAQPGTQAAINQVIPGTVDKAMPYYVPDPRAHAVSSGQAPVIGVDVSSIINKGKPVVLNLSGDGFFAYSSARITWYDPRGSVYQRIVVPTDDRGLMQVALLWTPELKLGVAGNGGIWKISAVDEVSGQEADTQVYVADNAGTPPVSDWSASGAPQVTGAPAVGAGTSGYLCVGPGAWSDVTLQGFQPETRIDLAFYSSSGKRLLLVQGLRSDAIGQVSNILDFWKIQGCDSSESFDYTVVADAPSRGQRAQAEIELTTK